MAKKNTRSNSTTSPSDPAAPARRRSAGARPSNAITTEAPTAEPNGTPPMTLDRADDNGRASLDSFESPTPSHDQIAEEAYRRYLDRGGAHGQDFDDWLEAERSLRTRK